VALGTLKSKLLLETVMLPNQEHFMGRTYSRTKMPKPHGLWQPRVTAVNCGNNSSNWSSLLCTTGMQFMGEMTRPPSSCRWVNTMAAPCTFWPTVHGGLTNCTIIATRLFLSKKCFRLGPLPWPCWGSLQHTQTCSCLKGDMQRHNHTIDIK